MLGAWERHRGGGALLPFVLRVVAGACVGRGTGQTRMPPQERLHEELGGLGDCFTCSGVVIRRRAVSGETARGVLVFFGDCSGVGGGLFHTRGAWERHRGGEALLPFVLRAVAGACVGRWTGQPRMPPQERLHEGLGGYWGILSHARSLGTTQRERGAVAVCFEGGCGSICWPRESL